MRTIAVMNQKGGCGKTTVSINLASALAEADKRVLLVDMDPQSHCAVGLAVPEEDVERSIYDVLISRSHNEPIRLTEILWQISENLEIAPASIDLSAFEQQMAGIADRETCLKTVLDEVQDEYDFTVVDCPPAVNLLTFNALRAATDVIVPVETGYFALHGLSKQLETLGILCKRCQQDVSVRVLANMYDTRTKMAREILAELRSHFAGRMLRSVVNLSTRIKEAHSFGQPINEYDPASKGQQDFRMLAQEIIGGEERPLAKGKGKRLVDSLADQLEEIAANANELLKATKPIPIPKSEPSIAAKPPRETEFASYSKPAGAPHSPAQNGTTVEPKFAPPTGGTPQPRRMAQYSPVLSADSPKPPHFLVQYPSIRTPTHVLVQQAFTLRIALRHTPERGTSGLVMLQDPSPDREQFDVEFEVLSDEFAFEGDLTRGVIRVYRDQDEAYSELRLLPLPFEGDHRLADIRVLFFFNGKRCGMAHRTLLIVGQETDWHGDEEEPPQGGAALKFYIDDRGPDLEFTLVKNSDDYRHFLCHVNSPFLKDVSRRDLRSTLHLPMDAANYIENLYKRIQIQNSGAAAGNCLASIGDILYDITPECFRIAYWRLRDSLGDQFQTIQIYSDEAWIPWELMRPRRQCANGTTEERAFLGVECSVGRWLNDTLAGAPMQHFVAESAMVVAPKYPSGSLKYAQKEATWLTRAIKAARLKPATKEQMITFLLTGEAQILHFSCHGNMSADPNEAEILLEDSPLSSMELRNRDMRSGLAGKCKPLVFINACESGRTGVTLGGIGGLAPAFIDISCGAVVGTLWSVDDRDALEIVKTFYNRVLKSPGPTSLASVLREIRGQFVKDRRDSFLAYTFFGDPRATLSLVTKPRADTDNGTG